jgi:hypothetical protein
MRRNRGVPSHSERRGGACPYVKRCTPDVIRPTSNDVGTGGKPRRPPRDVEHAQDFRPCRFERTVELARLERATTLLRASDQDTHDVPFMLRATGRSGPHLHRKVGDRLFLAASLDSTVGFTPTFSSELNVCTCDFVPSCSADSYVRSRGLAYLRRHHHQTPVVVALVARHSFALPKQASVALAYSSEQRVKSRVRANRRLFRQSR